MCNRCSNSFSRSRGLCTHPPSGKQISSQVIITGFLVIFASFSTVSWFALESKRSSQENARIFTSFSLPFDSPSHCTLTVSHCTLTVLLLYSHCTLTVLTVVTTFFSFLFINCFTVEITPLFLFYFVFSHQQNPLISTKSVSLCFPNCII